MAGDGGDGSGNLGTEPKPPGRAETAGRWMKPLDLENKMCVAFEYDLH